MPQRETRQRARANKVAAREAARRRASSAVAAKLEQEEHITSSKFNQHFQTALEEGLTDALMDELGSFFVCFGICC